MVVDGGNGMAGPMVGPLLEKLGLDLVTTYWTPDGNFPDHEPNPLLEENRRFIIDKVREEGADLGIAWDGDADRCFFIDDTGAFVDGDFMTALLAESILEKKPGADILYDVRASRAVPDLVERLGGKAHMNRVGHAFFKRRMRDEGGAFGGEVSGHYYFADFYNADSGTVPALLILELLSKKDAKLSDLVEQFRSKYFISGEINSEVSDTDAEARRARGEVLRRRDHQARRAVRGLRGLALQRAAVEHGAAAAPEPRERRLQGGHGAPARRGAAADHVVIHRLSIPTPFMVGRVNCYLIDDEPLTLIDCGPNSGKALDELEQALAGHGRRIEDLERIVITHQHLDHLGLVDILARRSGAEVCALDLLAPVIENFAEHAESDDEMAEELMLAPRHPARRRDRAAGGVADGARLGRLDRRLPAARRGRAARVRGPRVRGAPPSRALSLGHGVLRPRGRDAGGRRPPDQAHLLQPAHLQAARRHRRRESARTRC